MSTSTITSPPFTDEALDATLPVRVHLAWQLVTRHPDSASSEMEKAWSSSTKTRKHASWQGDHGHVLSTLR